MKPSEKTSSSKPDRSATPAANPGEERRKEALRMLEEYADDLREIIAKLRPH